MNTTKGWDDKVIVPKKYIFFNYLENSKTYQGSALSVM
jgi:hypothetical protein